MATSNSLKSEPTKIKVRPSERTPTDVFIYIWIAVAFGACGCFSCGFMIGFSWNPWEKTNFQDSYMSSTSQSTHDSTSVTTTSETQYSSETGAVTLMVPSELLKINTEESFVWCLKDISFFKIFIINTLVEAKLRQPKVQLESEELLTFVASFRLKFTRIFRGFRLQILMPQFYPIGWRTIKFSSFDFSWFCGWQLGGINRWMVAVFLNTIQSTAKNSL